MRIIYSNFKENEENIDSISIGFKNSILEQLKNALDFYSLTLIDVELHTDCFDIDLGNPNAIVEGVWVSHDGDNYLLSVYFYPSAEAVETYSQKYLVIALTDKQFKQIEEHFLMEERCLVG